MGQLFHSFGLLPTADVVEISVADLTTGYAGQASKAATKVLNGARGKVLFIDEAYQLNPAAGGVYMQEVVDAMTQALTSEELLGQVVVILAGYEAPLDDMLDANQGLRSRFTEKLLFRDFPIETVQQLLRKEIENDFGVENMDDGVLPAIPSIAQKLIQVPMNVHTPMHPYTSLHPSIHFYTLLHPSIPFYTPLYPPISGPELWQWS